MEENQIKIVLHYPEDNYMGFCFKVEVYDGEKLLLEKSSLYNKQIDETHLISYANGFVHGYLVSKGINETNPNDSKYVETEEYFH